MDHNPICKVLEDVLVIRAEHIAVHRNGKKTVFCRYLHDMIDRDATGSNGGLEVERSAIAAENDWHQALTCGWVGR